MEGFGYAVVEVRDVRHAVVQSVLRNPYCNSKRCREDEFDGKGHGCCGYNSRDGGY
jgi:hypothetical protein